MARSLLGGVALCGTTGMAAACLVAAVGRPLLGLGAIANELAALVGFAAGALVAVLGAVTAKAAHARPRAGLARLGTTGGVAVLVGVATAVVAAVASVRAAAHEMFGQSVGGAYGEAAGAVIFFVVLAVVGILASIAGGVFVALVLGGSGALHLAMDRAAARRGAGRATLAFAGGGLGVVLLVEGTATALGFPTAPAATLVPAALLVVAAVRAREAARPWVPGLAIAAGVFAFSAAMVAWGAFEERHRLALRALPSCGALPPVSGVACQGYSHTWHGSRLDPETFVVPDGSRTPEEVRRLVTAAVPPRCVDRPAAFAPIESKSLPIVVADPVDVRLAVHVHRQPDATVDDARLAETARAAVRERAASIFGGDMACQREGLDLGSDGFFGDEYFDCGARSQCRWVVEAQGCAAKACVVGTDVRRYLRRLDVDVDVVRP